ncbi:MAG TPA: hypothetical protein VHA53_07875 [Nitrolancea sp.]|nr:hypothetical protein [Nitrolancea sp.]
MEKSTPPSVALLEVVRLIPWTTISVVLIIIVACVNGTLHRYPSDTQLARWGTGLQALRDGRIWTIITTNFLIDHPVAIISTIVLSIVATGSCELYYGTANTIFAWFVGAWLPLLLAAVLLLPAHVWRMQATIDRLMAPEVGSSTATWCCAGAVVGFPLVVHGWRRLAGSGALVVLLAILAYRPDYASLEHLSAFAVGMALYHLWRGRPSRIGRLTRARAARLMSIVCGAVFLVELVVTGVRWESIALLPLGLALLLTSLFVPDPIDRSLAILALLGGILANLLEPNAATVLAVAAVLWLTLYRGRWTLPEEPAVV